MKTPSFLSESDYNFIYSRSPRFCVDLVIKNKNGVHLIKRDIQPYKGKFHLPGGRVRFRESIDAAIKRVAKTELDINVTPIGMIGYMEFPRETQDGNKRHSISLAFLVKPLSVLVSPKYDHSKVHPIHYKFLKENKFL